MSIYLSKRRSQNGQKKGAFACIFKTKRQKHRPGLANSRFVCFFWLLSFFLSESCCAPPHKSIRSINLMKYKIYLLGNASEMQLNWNDSLNDVSTIRTSFDFYIIVCIITILEAINVRKRSTSFHFKRFQIFAAMDSCRNDLSGYPPTTHGFW